MVMTGAASDLEPFGGGRLVYTRSARSGSPSQSSGVTYPKELERAQHRII